MIMKYNHLSDHPNIFLKMAGLHLHEFDQLGEEMPPHFAEAEYERLSRPNRQREMGSGRRPELDARNQISLTVIWLRVYPTHEVSGYLSGVSDSTAGRVANRVLPFLERAGRDTTSSCSEV